MTDADFLERRVLSPLSLVRWKVRPKEVPSSEKP